MKCDFLIVGNEVGYLWFFYCKSCMYILIFFKWKSY